MKEAATTGDAGPDDLDQFDPDEIKLTPDERVKLKRRRLEVARRYLREESIPAIAAALNVSESTIRRDVKCWNLEQIKRARIDSHELRGVILDTLREKDEKARFDSVIEGMRLQTSPDGRTYTQIEVKRPLPADAPFGVFPPEPNPLVEEIREGGKLFLRRYVTPAELEEIKRSCR